MIIIIIITKKILPIKLFYKTQNFKNTKKTVVPKIVKHYNIGI